MRTALLIAALVVIAALGFWLARTQARAPSLPLPPVAAPPAPPVARPTHAPSPSPRSAASGPVRSVRLAPRASNGRIVVRAAWGGGPGELGRRRDPESAPEGPMSLVADHRGNLWVLDQVNHRIQRWAAAGQPLASLPIAGDTAQDLALGKLDAVGLLDRLAEENVQLYRDGRLIGEVALRGAGVGESGGTTGLFSDGNGDFYVEREHTQLVRVADSSGNADASHATLPGRPTRDGRLYLNGALVDQRGAILITALDAGGATVWQSRVELPAPALLVVLLDSDAVGNVYVAAHIGRESAAPPYRVVDERVLLAGLDAEGGPRGALTLPAAPSDLESFREFTVGDNGTVYRMVKTAAGVTIEAYRL